MKRAAAGSDGDDARAKRGREMVVAPAGAGAGAQAGALVKRAAEATVARTSNLAEPNMLLEGHDGAAVYALAFNPSGQHVATGGADKRVFLWDVFGECRNYAVLAGHGRAVLDVAWASDSSWLATAGADCAVALWDAETAERTQRISAHDGIVNCVSTLRRGPPLAVSGSDDLTARVWDERTDGEAAAVLRHPYQVTAACFGDAPETVVTGGIDNVVRVWDTRKAGSVVRELAGHADTVTGLALSPAGTHVLSNAMDSTLRVWDIRPFAAGDRCVATLEGHVHNFEKLLLRCAWSPDGDRVVAGSADGMLNVWDTTSGDIVYRLPGHLGSINAVAFHPSEGEPIVASAGSDGQVFLGELGVLG